MKRALLLIAVSALLVTLGFAQTPAAGDNTDPANVKGCLGGSDGSFTVAEDGTGQIFKINTSIVDLKPHVGHNVKLTGHKSSGTVSSGVVDTTFAVTELSMISEHCTAATAASTVPAVPYSQSVIEPATGPAAPAATPNVVASTSAVDTTAPAAPTTPSSAAVSAPAVDPAAPVPTASSSQAAVTTPVVEPVARPEAPSPSSATTSTPAVESAAPAVTPSPSSEALSKPAADAAQPVRPSARVRKLAAKQAAAIATDPAVTVTPPADGVAPTPSDAATPVATPNPSPEAVSSPDPAPTAPTVVAHRGGSLWLLVSFVILVILLGTTAPLISRWRKRKLLERTGAPNLSFTNDVSTNVVRADEASSDQKTVEPTKAA